ncbi:hypothetical protein T492DRAFT_1143753 [Pavlovales sp. CCMP2436]|nr:hypothetical protein T492DRAFT_1143753 [Pavlovales sp. CCMP2436]
MRPHSSGGGLPSHMEVLPSDLPSGSFAGGGSSAPRPRSGSATSHFTIKPTPIKRAGSGQAALARTMPLADAGAVPFRDASSARRSNPGPSEVYKPIGLSLFNAGAATRRAAADAAAEAEVCTPAPSDGGLDEAAQEVLRRELRAHADQLKGIRDVDSADRTRPRLRKPLARAAPPTTPQRAWTAEGEGDRSGDGVQPRKPASSFAEAHAAARLARSLGEPGESERELEPQLLPPALLLSEALDGPATDKLLDQLLALDAAELRSVAYASGRPSSAPAAQAEASARHEAEVAHTRNELQSYIDSLRTSDVRAHLATRAPRESSRRCARQPTAHPPANRPAPDGHPSRASAPARPPLAPTHPPLPVPSPPPPPPARPPDSAPASAQLVEFSAEHDADVAGMVRSAITSGERPSLDDADTTPPSLGESWIDRIELGIDGADSALVAAVGEMRRLDRVLRAKTQKLARVRRRGRVELEGLAALAAEDQAARAGGGAHVGRGTDAEGVVAELPAAVAPTAVAGAAEELARRDEEEEAEEAAAMAAVAQAQAAAQVAAAAEEVKVGTPPGTAGTVLLGPAAFLTSTGFVNGREVTEAGAHATTQGGGALGGMTAASLLAEAAAELAEEGEAAHLTLFARLGIPALDADARTAEAVREAEEAEEGFEQRAQALDPRIVILSEGERRRLRELEALSDAELRRPLVDAQVRARLDAITNELAERFVRPTTALAGGGGADAPLAERAAAALEAAAPVERPVGPLRTAAEEATTVTTQGYTDYARELRFDGAVRSALGAIDARLALLYARPRAAAPTPPTAERAGTPATAASEAALAASVGERVQLDAILATEQGGRRRRRVRLLERRGGAAGGGGRRRAGRMAAATAVRGRQ